MLIQWDLILWIIVGRIYWKMNLERLRSPLVFSLLSFLREMFRNEETGPAVCPAAPLVLWKLFADKIWAEKNREEETTETCFRTEKFVFNFTLVALQKISTKTSTTYISWGDKVRGADFESLSCTFLHLLQSCDSRHTRPSLKASKEKRK